MLKVYGIEGTDGYIADPTRCYQNQPYYIFPQLNVSGDLANGISSQMVLLTNAHGMTLTDPTRDTITTSAFMETSENGYAVTESEQKQGTYELGVVATETISSGDDSSSDSSDAEATDTTTDDSESTEDSEESSTTEARLTVISAGSLIDQNITDAFSQLENTQIFMNAVSANFDGAQNLSIEAKSLGTEYNTIQHAGLFSLLVIFGIPAVILIAGFSVWFRRRKSLRRKKIRMKKKKGPLILIGVRVLLLILYFALSTWNKKQDSKEEETVKVTDLKTSEITGVKYNLGTGEMNFEKNGDTWYYTADKDFPLRQSYPKTVADAMGQLSADRELEDADALEEYGLDHPTYTVTLTDEDGTVTTIKVGNATGNDYYATVDDTEKVYTIPATSLDDIRDRTGSDRSAGYLSKHRKWKSEKRSDHTER